MNEKKIAFLYYYILTKKANVFLSVSSKNELNENLKSGRLKKLGFYGFCFQVFHIEN